MQALNLLGLGLQIPVDCQKMSNFYESKFTLISKILISLTKNNEKKAAGIPQQLCLQVLKFTFKQKIFLYSSIYLKKDSNQIKQKQYLLVSTKKQHRDQFQNLNQENTSPNQQKQQIDCKDLSNKAKKQIILEELNVIKIWQNINKNQVNINVLFKKIHFLIGFFKDIAIRQNQLYFIKQNRINKNLNYSIKINNPQNDYSIIQQIKHLKQYEKQKKLDSLTIYKIISLMKKNFIIYNYVYFDIQQKQYKTVNFLSYAKINQTQQINSYLSKHMPPQETASNQEHQPIQMIRESQISNYPIKYNVQRNKWQFQTDYQCVQETTQFILSKQTQFWLDNGSKIKISNSQIKGQL